MSKNPRKCEFDPAEPHEGGHGSVELYSLRGFCAQRQENYGSSRASDYVMADKKEALSQTRWKERTHSRVVL